ncbi:DUF3138 family protein [Paucibacter sp. AS339]|uniref:DUF3138 family protein n=1 Tax=Paucibacter hankyongi TaxID=3133434 RepID=UPI0030B2ED87
MNMKNFALTPVLALMLTANSAQAQSAAELAAKLKAMQEAMTAMQAQLQELQSKSTETSGMTPDQARQLNRTTVRSEALEEAQETMGYKGLKISGLIDPSYIYSQGQNRSGFQFLNSSQNGEFAYDNGAFGMAMLDFQKEFEGGSKMRLTLAPNRGGGGVAIDGQSIVHEASFSVPLTDLQTRLIGGQVPDWSGHEIMQSNQNRFVTHNLLFDFTLPAVYTGAGLELQRSPWLVKAMLANVNSSRKNNGQKTPALVYRVDFYDYKREFNGWGFAGMHGKLANWRATDPAGNPVTGQPYASEDTMVHTFEVDGFFSRGDWTLSGQASIGMQRKAAISADTVSGELRDSQWWGLSGMAAYKLSQRLELMARLDYLNNRKNGGGTLGYSFADARNGLGPDPLGDAARGAIRSALSLGARYQLNAFTQLKLEYRLDHADLPVFLHQGSQQFKRQNQLLGGSVVMSF